MISPIEKRKLEVELEESQSELKVAAQQLEDTAAQGDLRENDPFHIAKEKYVSLRNKIEDIKKRLKQPVGSPVGISITKGVLLKITYLGVQDNNGKIIEAANEVKLLLFAEKGGSVIQGILSVDSDLGCRINNGREGRYSISDGKTSRLYDVRIYKGDVEEYFKKFPVSRKQKIKRLLRGDVM